jgi:hypothetical protein
MRRRMRKNVLPEDPRLMSSLMGRGRVRVVRMCLT